MIYTKIRLDFKYGPKGRFFRTILVKNDINLLDLSVGLCLILKAEFEHCFLITEKRTFYVMAPFMENPLPGYKHLCNYCLTDLGDVFNFEYDTGESWDFVCKKYKKEVELNSKKDIIVLDGAGLGIWEDNVHSLYGLFAGKIDPKSSEEDEENCYCLPWNLELNTYGDFDLPLDIDDLNDMLTSMYKSTVNRIKKYEKEYIKENNVNTNDYEGNEYEKKIFN